MINTIEISKISDRYEKRGRTIKSIGLPLTLALSLFSLKGCYNVCTENDKNPYKNETAVVARDDLAQLETAVGFARGNILPYEPGANDPTFYIGALPKARNYIKVNGLKGENSSVRQEVISQMESMVSNLDAIRTNLQIKKKALSEDPIVKKYDEHFQHGFCEGAKRFGLFGILAIIAGFGTVIAFDKNTNKASSELAKFY